MMHDIIGLLFWLVTTLVIGRSLLHIILYTHPFIVGRFEKTALSYCLGIGFVTVEMIFFSLAGIRFSILSILLGATPFVVYGAVIYFRTKRIPTQSIFLEDSATVSLTEKLLFAGISLQAVYIFFKALIKPVEAYDALAIYAFKAKIFYLSGIIPADFFKNFKGFVPHIEYPLLVPLAETYLYTFLGSLNDLAVKIISPLYYAAILIIFYFVARRILSRKLSLLVTFLLATVPQFSEYATNGYADLVLAANYSISLFYLFLWMRKGERGFLVLSSVFSILSILTKTEGLMLAGINGIILLVYIFTSRGRMKSGVIYLFVLSTFMVCYMTFRKALGLDLHGDLVGGGPAGILNRLARLPAIIYEYQRQFFGPKKWNMIWIFFLAAAAARNRRIFSGESGLLAMAVFFIFFGYTTIYLAIPRDISWHLSTTGSRFFIHFLPVIALWLGLVFNEMDLKI